MAWRIELSVLARKNLRDIDQQIAGRILRFLREFMLPAPMLFCDATIDFLSLSDAVPEPI